MARLARFQAEARKSRDIRKNGRKKTRGTARVSNIFYSLSMIAGFVFLLAGFYT